MGSYERSVVQAAEVSIVAFLNSGRSRLAAAHPWSGHDVAVAQRLAADFPVAGATHTGNRYDSPGDIRLTLRDASREVLVETKLSDSEAGVGTAANISQDALTKYGIFTDVEAWSAWRRRRGYAEVVGRILDRWPPARRVGTIPDKGRLVRDAARNDPVARSIQDAVVAYANDDRSAYQALLRTKPVNAERLREFVLALFMGAHTAAEINELLESGLPRTPADVPANYYVYYTNFKHGRIVVRSHTPDTLKQLLSVTDYRLELEHGTHTAHITAQAGDDRVELLHFLHHWKNVFIGIETPCINVFLGTYPVRLLRD